MAPPLPFPRIIMALDTEKMEISFGMPHLSMSFSHHMGHLILNIRGNDASMHSNHFS